MTAQREMLYQFCLILLRRKWTMMVTFLVVLAGVCGYTYLGYPLYKSTVKIMVHENPKKQLILFRDIATPAQSDIRIKPAANLIEISRSKGIAQEIVKKYGLDTRLARRAQSPETIREECWYWINKILNFPIRAGEMIGIFSESTPNYEYLAVEKFLDDIQDISLVLETDLVNLSVWEESPQLATSIANTLARLLLDKTIALQQLKTSTAVEFTREQVKIAGQDLDRMEERLAQLKNKAKLIDPEKQKTLKLNTLEALEKEYLEVVEEETESKAQLAGLLKQFEGVSPEIVSSEVTAYNPLVTELKSYLYRNEMELASREPDLKKSHPEILTLEAKIRDNREKLKGEEKEIIQSRTTSINAVYQQLYTEIVNLQGKISGLSARRGTLKEQLTDLEKECLLLIEKEVRLNKMERDVSTQEGLFMNLKNKLGELEVEQVNRLSEFDIKIVDEAYLPNDADPDWPDWEITIIVGVCAGLFSGLLLGLFVDYLDQSYTSSRQLAGDIEVPVLGSLPRSKILARMLRHRRPRGA